MKRISAVLKSNVLLVRRRARNDVALLATVVALVATAAMLAVVGPGLVIGTIDEGAQDTVASASGQADVIVKALVGQPVQGISAFTPDGIVRLAEDAPANLPPSLAAVYDNSTLTVVGSPTKVSAIDGVAWSGAAELNVAVGMLTAVNSAALTLVDGRLPAHRTGDDTSPIEIVLSTDAAAAAKLAIGSQFDLRPPRVIEDESAEEPPGVSVFEVVGIIANLDPSPNGVWQDTLGLWSPIELGAAPGQPQQTNITVLAETDGLAEASVALTDPFEATLRMRVDPKKFTAALAVSAAVEAHQLRADAQDLAGESQVDLAVDTDLEDVLAGYPVQAKAALAQMTVMMAGVIGIAAVVITLLSRLLVMRRLGAIALERARGSSVVNVGLRALIESIVTTAVGVIVGVLVAMAVLRTLTFDVLPVIAVTVVALLAAPVQAMIFARLLWTGRREPANRADRHRQAKGRRAQRLVVEVAVVALAVAALVSLRGRGLLQNRSEGIDPFLAVAPLMLAIAITLIVIRLYPFPVRIVGAAAKRTRGVLGLLGAVRALSAIAALPLLALTLGAALSVSGALLVDTVRTGQDTASWQRIGADVRVRTILTADQLDELRSAPGVTVVSETRPRDNVGLDLGTSSRPTTVMAIDENFADLVDQLPGEGNTDSLRELATASAGERLPVIVDKETAKHLISDDIAMYYGPLYTQLHVIGTTDYTPDGYVVGPYVYVDLKSIVALMPEGYGGNSVLLAGPGAAEAADKLELADDLVQSRAEWVSDRRDSALIDGVERTMLFAIIAVAVLSAVALVATVVSGARGRGRALSMLRTLGMSPRLGWWLALAELAPLVIAAIIGGVAAGIAVVLALAPSLGLDVLSGGTSVPATSVTPVVFISLAVSAVLLLLLGALSDVLVHRKDKLSEVLRVGETV